MAGFDTGCESVSRVASRILSNDDSLALLACTGLIGHSLSYPHQSNLSLGAAICRLSSVALLSLGPLSVSLHAAHPIKSKNEPWPGSPPASLLIPDPGGLLRFPWVTKPLDASGRPGHPAERGVKSRGSFIPAENPLPLPWPKNTGEAWSTPDSPPQRPICPIPARSPSIRRLGPWGSWKVCSAPR